MDARSLRSSCSPGAGRHTEERQEPRGTPDTTAPPFLPRAGSGAGRYRRRRHHEVRHAVRRVIRPASDEALGRPRPQTVAVAQAVGAATKPGHETQTAAKADPRPPETAPVARRAAPGCLPPGAPRHRPQAVYDGWKQFNLNCARCHGEDVSGTTIAPHLILSLKPDGPINSKELFVSTVCSGRPEKGMPAWCALGMEIDKIQDIYLYVKGRSDAKISPGRPAVRSQG